jgi:hypothetical protein
LKKVGGRRYSGAAFRSAKNAIQLRNSTITAAVNRL